MIKMSFPVLCCVLLLSAITHLTAAPGELLWSQKLSGEAMIVPWKAVDGTVFVILEYESARSDYLWALDAGQGTRKWWKSLSSRGVRPVLEDGVLYTGTSSGSLMAVEMVHGEELWKVELENDGRPLYTSPLLVNGILYAETGYTLYAIAAQDGRILWRLDWEENAYCRRTPLFWNGRLFSRVWKRPQPITYSLRCVDPLSGNVERIIPLDSGIGNAPVEKDGIAYYYCYDFSIRALDLASGIQLWKYDLEEEEGHIEYPLLLGDGALYFTTKEKGLCAVDRREGKLRYQVGSDGCAPPVLEGGIIYFYDRGGMARAVNERDGEIGWCLETGCYSYAPLHYSAGMLYYPVRHIDYRKSGLLAISARDGTRQWFFGHGGIDSNLQAQAVTADGMVFLGDNWGGIYAVEAGSR